MTETRAPYAAKRKHFSKALVDEIAYEARQLCALCGRIVGVDDRSLDHIIPLAAGGSNDRANLQLAHRACNNKRGCAPVRQSTGRPLTEAQFEVQVKGLAKLYGYLYYHTWNSIHSAPGFPDCVLVKAPRVIFAELKSARGVLSDDQQRWIEALSACPGYEVFVWRPEDLERVREVLAL